MDGGDWQAAVHAVAKSRTWLSDFTVTFYFHALEKEMATRSSVLAWRIPGTGEPCGLPSMGVTQSQTQLKRLSSSSKSIMPMKQNNHAGGICSVFIVPHCLHYRQFPKSGSESFSCKDQRTNFWAVAQRLKRLPAMQETWVRSLGREDPLEKEMATHSSILAWRIPWTEEPGGLQPTGSQRVWHDWVISLSFTFPFNELYSLCHNYSTLSVLSESSCRQ